MYLHPTSLKHGPNIQDFCNCFTNVLETNQWINPQYPDLDLLVVLPVDNDGGDLLVHEDEDGGQQGEHRG